MDAFSDSSSDSGKSFVTADGQWELLGFETSKHSEASEMTVPAAPDSTPPEDTVDVTNGGSAGPCPEITLLEGSSTEEARESTPELPVVVRVEPTSAYTRENVKLQSLIPLLELLAALQIHKGQFVLNGGITEDDVKRVVEYAEKVTEFIHPATTSSNETITISPVVYVTLLQRTPAPLFPRLHSINLHSVSSRLQYLPLLLSPSLTRLEITNISSPSVQLVKSFLATLPVDAPGIKHFVLRGPSNLSESALYLIPELKQLQTLELNDVTIRGTSFLEDLSTLPLLEELVFGAQYTPVFSSPPLDSSQNRAGFPKLKTLHLSGSHAFMLELVSLVSSQEFHSITLDTCLPESEFDAAATPDSLNHLQVRRREMELVQQEHKERQDAARRAAEDRLRAKSADISSSKDRIDGVKAELLGAKVKHEWYTDVFNRILKQRVNKRVKKKLRRLEDSGASERKLERTRKSSSRTFPLFMSDLHLFYLCSKNHYIIFQT
ncbi:hypothetical protein BDQ17DRAFT_1427274 [Cyathus striatus]|nr:hypothetical protein BDQ17DRAFT_1427274 [Cyathus striatus]